MSLSWLIMRNIAARLSGYFRHLRSENEIESVISSWIAVIQSFVEFSR